MMLEIRGLGRILPPPEQRVLLRGVSFALDRGEVLAVVGPSGSGKSTLLRLLNRLDEPTMGEVLLQGRNTRSIPPRELRRRIGMVMQRAYLFPGTVSENVSYGPLQQQLPFQEEEIQALLEQVGLPGYAARNALTLSGGEAQRVAIARALANQPEVLLLDEPTSALDEDSRYTIEALLESLVRQRHLTCVWVTHHIEQARTIADKVVALKSGEMIGCGSVQEVLRA